MVESAGKFISLERRRLGQEEQHLKRWRGVRAGNGTMFSFPISGGLFLSVGAEPEAQRSIYVQLFLGVGGNKLNPGSVLRLSHLEHLKPCQYP